MTEKEVRRINFSDLCDKPDANQETLKALYAFFTEHAAGKFYRLSDLCNEKELKDGTKTPKVSAEKKGEDYTVLYNGIEYEFVFTKNCIRVMDEENEYTNKLLVMDSARLPQPERDDEIKIKRLYATHIIELNHEKKTIVITPRKQDLQTKFIKDERGALSHEERIDTTKAQLLGYRSLQNEGCLLFSYNRNTIKQAYPYVPGKPLNDILEALTKDEVLKIILDMIEQLQKLHEEAKLVHADLKLENILYDKKSNQGTLIDLELAQVINSEITRSVGNLVTFAPEMFLLYMRIKKEELLKGKENYKQKIINNFVKRIKVEKIEVKECIDLYALGVVMLQLLTKDPIANVKTNQQLFNMGFPDAEKKGQIKFYDENFATHLSYGFTDEEENLLRGIVNNLVKFKPDERCSLGDAKQALQRAFFNKNNEDEQQHRIVLK